MIFDEIFLSSKARTINSSIILFILAPGVPPPNVTVSDLNSTAYVKYSWDAIPLEDENGYMEGYKIRYQLVRRGGVDVTVGNDPVTLTFDRFVFAHTIANLDPYSEYKVEVFGYSKEGDGPAHVSYARKLTGLLIL